MTKLCEGVSLGFYEDIYSDTDSFGIWAFLFVNNSDCSFAYLWLRSYSDFLPQINQCD
jgi:hypothetical protein